jgi:hypothetical protein
MAPTKQARGMDAYRRSRDKALRLTAELDGKQGTNISSLINLVNHASKKDTMQLYREAIATRISCCYGYVLPCCHILMKNSHLINDTPIQILLETLEVDRAGHRHGVWSHFFLYLSAWQLWRSCLRRSNNQSGAAPGRHATALSVAQQEDITLMASA